MLMTAHQALTKSRPAQKADDFTEVIEYIRKRIEKAIENGSLNCTIDSFCFSTNRVEEYLLERGYGITIEKTCVRISWENALL